MEPMSLDDKRVPREAGFFAKISTLNRNFRKSFGYNFFNILTLGHNILQKIGMSVLNTLRA